MYGALYVQQTLSVPVMRTNQLMTCREIISVYFDIHEQHASASCRQKIGFLGATAKLREVTIAYILSVYPSLWKNSAPIKVILMKFDI